VTNTGISGPNKYRALFLSDIHLGSNNCKAAQLLAFLGVVSADVVYLVGDILDGDRFLNWLPIHYEVLRALLRLSGRLVIVPGNHDRWMRSFLGAYGSVEIHRQALHLCAGGRVLLVSHGDETDVITSQTVIRFISSIERVTRINLWEVLRRWAGVWIRHHTHQYENLMIAMVPNEYDGVVCGHIHFPNLREGYINSGDWTHHCSAAVEHHDGTFEILYGLKGDF
jgi:UDP-2,3-diacylglucosamine pyrophosphatase LpxH